MASENSSPPTTTVWPRAAAPSMSARTLRSAMVVSTNTAPTCRVTSRSTSQLMRSRPASDSVDMPWMPSTSSP